MKDVPAVSSFQGKLQQFLDKLEVGQEEKNTIEIEVIRLALHIQEGMGSTKLRRLTFKYNCIDEFTFFKNQYLDMSFYIHRLLWVAVAAKIQNGMEPEAEPLVSDVNYVINRLSDEDIEKVRNLRPNPDLNVDSLDLGTMRTGKKTKRLLIPYVKSKSYTLNFLAEYDRGLDIEDLEQDLLCELVRVYNSYPRSRGRNLDKNPVPLEERVQMYLERAVNNKVNNLKEYYTCESRRRVASTDAHLYKERNRLKKLMAKDPANPELVQKFAQANHNLRVSDGDFYSTTTPLTRRDSSGGEERTIDVSEELGAGYGTDPFLVNTLQSTDTRIWLESICERVDERIANFIRIVTGYHNPEFESWARENKIDLERFDNLVKGARKFCQVNPEELRENDILEEELFPLMGKAI